MQRFKKATIVAGLVFTMQTAGSAAVLPPVVSHARTTYVWIAPRQKISFQQKLYWTS